MAAAEQADTIIGAQVELTGSLRNAGPIQIHGTVKGDVVSESTVFIGETAQVHGPVTGRIVEVAGSVRGSVTATEHVELHPKSRVDGDLRAPRLSVRPGAVFNGTCEMGGELPTSTEGENGKRRLKAEAA